jgi:hypothetical protein
MVYNLQLVSASVVLDTTLRCEAIIMMISVGSPSKLMWPRNSDKTHFSCRRVRWEAVFILLVLWRRCALIPIIV